MRPGLSKRLLSHFDDQLLESTGSDFNPELYLLYSKGRYQLVTDKVIYSFEDQYENFVEAFKNIDLNTIENVLILGYGIGSIPAILEKLYQKLYNYTAIEIDHEIIRLALKYTLPELKSKVDLIESDALTYLKHETVQYDLICFDVFINDQIPEKFLTTQCMQKNKETLKPKGVLIMNMLYLTAEDQNKTNEFFNSIFTKVFTNTKQINTKSNMMLIGWNSC